MFCHFDMTLEKAQGLSQQLQWLLGEPSQSPVNEVTEMVPVGEIMGSFPAGEVLRSCWLGFQSKPPAIGQTAHPVSLSCPWHLFPGLGRPLSSCLCPGSGWSLALPPQPLTLAHMSALPSQPTPQTSADCRPSRQVTVEWQAPPPPGPLGLGCILLCTHKIMAEKLQSHHLFLVATVAVPLNSTDLSGSLKPFCLVILLNSTHLFAGILYLGVWTQRWMKIIIKKRWMQIIFPLLLPWKQQQQ